MTRVCRKSEGGAHVLRGCLQAWALDGGTCTRAGLGPTARAEPVLVSVSLSAGRTFLCLPVPFLSSSFSQRAAPPATAALGGPCGVCRPWAGSRPTLGAALLLGPGSWNSVRVAPRACEAQTRCPGGGAWPWRAAWSGTLPCCLLLGHLEITVGGPLPEGSPLSRPRSSLRAEAVGPGTHPQGLIALRRGLPIRQQPGQMAHTPGTVPAPSMEF